MAWKKGESGNIKGKPKIVLADGRSLRDLAREHTQEAFDIVLKVMRDDQTPPAARVAAAQNIHDRGWGKPTQPIAGDDDMPAVSVAIDLTGMSTDTLRELAKHCA